MAQSSQLPGRGRGSVSDGNGRSGATLPGEDAAGRWPREARERDMVDGGSISDEGEKRFRDEPALSPGQGGAGPQPAPGPHADPALTDHDKTPGTGALPDAGDASDQKEADPGSG